MAKKKFHRSEVAYRRKMTVVWFGALFLLLVAVAMECLIIYNQLHPANLALSAEVDFSKIHFEGLSIDREIDEEMYEHRVVDADYDFSWNNISVSVDENNKIDRLGFYTVGDAKSEDGVNVKTVNIDYRDYPLTAVSDFVTYFGDAKIVNFGHYKYLRFTDDKYSLVLTLLDKEIYNIELSRIQK